MLEHLNCNACGAPLEVPDSAKFIRCNHCQTQLRIQRSASATFTESLDRLDQTTQQLAASVEQLTRQNELDALERQWESEREGFYLTDKHGKRHLPTKKMALVGSVIVAGFGVLWTIFAIALTSQAPDHGVFQIVKFIFPAFGLLFIAAALFNGFHAHQKATAYEAAYHRFQQQRQRLMEEE